MGEQNSEERSMRDSILSLLEGKRSKKKEDDKDMKVKKLRKMVLLSLQLEEEKSTKKTFKRVVQALEESKDVQIESDGRISLSGKANQKRKKKESKKDSCKKSKRIKTEDHVASSEDQNGESNATEEEKASLGETDAPATSKSGVTRLFLGNLPFTVTEASLESFLEGVTHIKWITDQETGKFYGSAFVEMDTPQNAAKAVKRAGAKLMGRPIKVNVAPARPGDPWPPAKKVVSGGSAQRSFGQAGGSGIKAMSVKPENCVKLFIGNLSYDIDDEKITQFFANVDAELKAVRWLHHQDSGDFKGCGYAEFWNTEACEKAAKLNGKALLGRPIRIDWSD